MELNNEHKEILNHTLYRAANRMYCGESREMDELCKAGLMTHTGLKSFGNDDYFTITADGRKALNQPQRKNYENI